MISPACPEPQDCGTAENRLQRRKNRQDATSRGDKESTRSGPLNRVRAVREQQGVTLRTISRRCGVPVRQLRLEEEPTHDLSITALLRWQAALEVPVSELLVEPEDALSLVIGQRAKLLRVMKTALSLRQVSRDERARRLSIMLCQQLQELMPELAEQSAWPSVGTRRSHEDVGRIAENPLRVDADLD